MNQVASSGVATSSNVPVATSFSALVNFSNVSRPNRVHSWQ